MTFFVHGAVLALVWFLLVNAAVSALVACTARPLLASMAMEPARRRAGVLFAIRLLPSLVSAIFVVGAFLPSYARLEPRAAGEPLDVTLAVIAAGGAALIGWSAWRGTRAWQRTVATAAQLIARSGLLDAGPGQPRAFVVDSPAPAVFLVGVLRPSLIVTRGLLDLLTAEELAATLRHEAGHRDAYDNLKRLALRCTPDLWSWTTAAGTIERGWIAAAERSADSAAASGSRRTALALASAIVKVARATPLCASLPCASTLADGADVAWRVRQLVADVPPPPASERVWIRFTTAAACAIAMIAAYGPLLTAVHAATEWLVQRLP